MIFSLLATSSIYEHLYGFQDDETGEPNFPATFQIFYFIGWKPGPNQPTPLTPQKSDVSLKDLPNLEEALEKKLEDKDKK